MTRGAAAHVSRATAGVNDYASVTCPPVRRDAARLTCGNTVTDTLLSQRSVGRILYFTDTYPPQVNGVSVVTALSVAGLRARGWEVAVVAPRYPAFPPRGVRVFTDDFGAADRYLPIPSLAFPPYRDIRLAFPAYTRMSRFTRDFGPDLVHCATEFMIGRTGQVIASRAGVPMVTSYHTDFSRYADAYGAPRLRDTISRYITRFHGRAARTYTPSEAARSDLRSLGVTDVEVWGRTVDTKTFHPSRRSGLLRSELGLEDKFVFLHVGRLAAEKGIQLILDAFQIARQELPPGRAHLVIAGGGPEEQRLRASAPKDVTFLGVLDRATALPPLYASADAFVFSSITETLGLVVLEAMASGLPVIAIPAGGVADHLRDNENGIACASDDVLGMARAMVMLVVDSSLRNRLAASARRTADALGWEAELDRLGASYREVIQAASVRDTAILCAAF